MVWKSGEAPVRLVNADFRYSPYQQVKPDFWNIKSINWFAVSSNFFKQQDVKKIHSRNISTFFGLLWLKKIQKDLWQVLISFMFLLNEDGWLLEYCLGDWILFCSLGVGFICSNLYLFDKKNLPLLSWGAVSPHIHKRFGSYGILYTYTESIDQSKQRITPAQAVDFSNISFFNQGSSFMKYNDSRLRVHSTNIFY